MQNSFYTPSTLYALLCPIKRPLSPTLLQQMSQWVISIRTSAPGAKILLLGSRVDEADDVAQVPLRCQLLVDHIAEQLQMQRRAEQAELEQLQSVAGAHGDGTAPNEAAAAARVKVLQQQLGSELLLPARAIPVSASTLEGLEDVKDQLLEAAFDKALFPHFGEVQPGTYGLIVRHLSRTHADHPSMTWPELEHAASTEPAIDVAAVDIRVSFRTSSLIHTDDGKAFRARLKEVAGKAGVDVVVDMVGGTLLACNGREGGQGICLLCYFPASDEFTPRNDAGIRTNSSRALPNHPRLSQSVAGG